MNVRSLLKIYRQKSGHATNIVYCSFIVSFWWILWKFRSFTLKLLQQNKMAQNDSFYYRLALFTIFICSSCIFVLIVTIPTIVLKLSHEKEIIAQKSVEFKVNKITLIVSGNFNLYYFGILNFDLGSIWCTMEQNDDFTTKSTGCKAISLWAPSCRLHW